VGWNLEEDSEMRREVSRSMDFKRQSKSKDNRGENKNSLIRKGK
jgi:hypothetical protein